MADREIETGYDPEPGKAMRWVGVLLPPIAWAMQMQTMWLTTEYGCGHSDFTWNHVASVAGLVLSAAGGLVAWRYWRTGNFARATADESSASVRGQFMGLVGAAMSATFTMLILWQWLPTILGVPCDK
jgi:hypothetical protein